jgi:hypothetical protein
MSAVAVGFIYPSVEFRIQLTSPFARGLLIHVMLFRWIGHRRTVGVKAVTKVVAVALSHDDMRWAVAHDFRMSQELTAALKARRLTVAKAIKAEKKAAKSVAA